MSLDRPIVPCLTNEAARILGVSPETVRVWERRGKLRALKTAAGVRLFDRLEVEELARARQRDADRLPVAV